MDNKGQIYTIANKEVASSEAESTNPTTKEDNIVSTDEAKGQNVDSSEAGTNNLGSNKVKDVVVGGEEVKSNLALDERTENWVKDLLQNVLKSEVQDIKKDFLVIFGLFASFVTFISINVQVFKNNENTLELIGICSISLSFIIFFALIINGIVKDSSDWGELKKPTYVFNLVFLILGIYFITKEDNKKIDEINLLKSKVLSDSTQINFLLGEVKALKAKEISFDSTLNVIGSRLKNQSRANNAIRNLDPKAKAQKQITSVP